jgi:hypothetical protein
VATDDALSFEVAASGEPTQLVFPYGYAAWRVDGVAQLVSPSGAVLAQEGDVVDGLMGSAADNGDFVLCFDPATKLVVTPGS